ncbi:hypothetical protein CDD82_1720 [Ophiocordyceps australis]|uniref:F-box domain-containing protein n=1 Tax=Ophiocordyceps australis TaxID=1399860 RepID=A0A2C5Y899_9HYPO|nr:hypothetical protein CDD82_1720 [Ophiocordyceps australis]
MESMKLHMLPMEILDMIYQHLNLEDLKTFSLCQHRFRDISERRIFERVIVSWDRAEVASSAIPFLGAILERPELATYVHTLRLVGGNYLAPVKRRVPYEILVKASEAIIATRMPDSDIWVQKLQAGSVDAVTTLLLVLLPNLTCIHQASPFCFDNEMLAKMLTHALSESAHDYQLPDFRKLNKFIVGYADTRETIRDEIRTTNIAENLLPVFRLPSLEHLHIGIPEETKAWPGVLPTCSSLIEFGLAQYETHGDKALLATMPSLKRFSWQWHNNLRWNRHLGGLNLDEADRALASVSDQLTYLGISLNYDRGDSEQMDGGVHIFGSLNTLPTMNNLTTLRFPWVFLMGTTNTYGNQFQSRIWSKLPESLIFLDMWPDLEDFKMDFKWGSSEAIQIMIRELEDRRDRSLMPKLETVRVPVPFKYSHWMDLVSEWRDNRIPYTRRTYGELSHTIGLKVRGRSSTTSSRNRYFYQMQRPSI